MGSCDLVSGSYLISFEVFHVHFIPFWTEDSLSSLLKETLTAAFFEREPLWSQHIHQPISASFDIFTRNSNCLASQLLDFWAEGKLRFLKLLLVNCNLRCLILKWNRISSISGQIEIVFTLWYCVDLYCCIPSLVISVKRKWRVLLKCVGEYDLWE